LLQIGLFEADGARDKNRPLGLDPANFSRFVSQSAGKDAHITQPVRLIVNADDFGLTPGINRAIAELHAGRALTSATLMANGPAFEDAVRIAHANPRLGIGAHIVLLDGTPIADPATIPTLLGADRRTLRPTLANFAAALLTGRIAEADIEREALAQIRKIQAAGIRLTHLDTHKHTHIFPRVLRPILRAAQSAGIPALRYPFEPARAEALTRSSTPLARRLQLRALRSFEFAFRQILSAQASVRATNGTLGIAVTGTLTRVTLRNLIAAAQDAPSAETYELCCHPGYNDPDLDRIVTRLRTHRNTEREALLATLPALLAAPDAPTLISYAALYKEPRREPLSPP
jgi:predicted glycoside hydrolase/deacetylase ChbG (UPF0249 family)